jgi:hypothetical protein
MLSRQEVAPDFFREGFHHIDENRADRHDDYEGRFTRCWLDIRTKRK